MRKSYFITAIDTDAGKSVATGLLARWLTEQGVRTITQKMAQTGCVGTSEDIATHRRIMGAGEFPEDRAGLTCPVVLPFPASPQLSAARVGMKIDLEALHEATLELGRRYDCVLVEGVGGLMVPLADDLTVADYLVRYPQPVILVSGGRLGSVNHTLLTLEALARRGVELVGVVYNRHGETDPAITADSRATIGRFLGRAYPRAAMVDLPRWEEGSPTPNLSELFTR